LKGLSFALLKVMYKMVRKKRKNFRRKVSVQGKGNSLPFLGVGGESERWCV